MLLYFRYSCKALGARWYACNFLSKIWAYVGGDVTLYISDILHGLIYPDYVNITNIASFRK